jgi:hypothetical protein
MGLLNKQNKEQVVTLGINKVDIEVHTNTDKLTKIKSVPDYIEADEETARSWAQIRIMSKLRKYGFDILFKPKELAKFTIDELGIIPGDDWELSWDKLSMWDCNPDDPIISVYIYEYMGNYIKFDVHLEVDESIVKYIANLSKCVISI